MYYRLGKVRPFCFQRKCMHVYISVFLLHLSFIKYIAVRSWNLYNEDAQTRERERERERESTRNIFMNIIFLNMHLFGSILFQFIHEESSSIK